MAFLVFLFSEYGRKFLHYLTIIGLVLIAVVEWVTDQILAITSWMLDEFQDFAVPDWQFNLSDYTAELSILNRLMPLAEAWAMFIITIAFALAVISVRWIKSIIPTLSN